MTIPQLQSQLRFTSQQLVAEALHWPRGSRRRTELHHAATQLAVAARGCRTSVSELARRGAEALLSAATETLVDSALSRAFTGSKAPQ